MSDICTWSVHGARLNIFSEILRDDPQMDSKELIARLIDSDLFTKDLAIKWSCDRLEYLRKHQGIFRKEFVKCNTPQRKFLTHVYEMAHLFLKFIPQPSDCFPRVTDDLYPYLDSLRKSHALVNICYMENNRITLKFPKIYDEILHGFFTGKRVNIDTRFRFWSDFKFEVLSPVKSSSDNLYIQRSFSFPEKLLHHDYLKQFMIDLSSQNKVLEIIGNLLIEYLQNMLGEQDLKILRDFSSRKKHLFEPVDYVLEFNKIVESKIEEWDKLI